MSSSEGVKRGPWTPEEDKILSDYIKSHGRGKWRNLPKQAGLKRCGKSCRLRWLNYLRPNIKRGNITKDEEDLIVRLHKLLGNRWSLIAGRIPGRKDNEIKNYWNSHLSKKMQDDNDDNTSRKLPIRPSSEGSDPPQWSKVEEKILQNNDEDPNYYNNLELGSSTVGNLGDTMASSKAEGSDGSLWLSKTRSEEEDSCGHDFLMDIYTREMSLSQFLDTDFRKLSSIAVFDIDDEETI